MTLSGYGNAKGATMTFAASNGGKVHLYTSNGGTSAVDNYSWTGNGTCQRWVGYWKSNTGNDNMTAAGTLTSSALTLTGSDGKTYSVAVSKMHSGVNAITISNPGST